VLMHAVSRLVLHPLIKNIQTSWVKMGAQGAAICLDAGANDLGGTLMNESITRAAGGVHGQELDASKLQALAHRIGRTTRQRTTLYGIPDEELPTRAPVRSREAPSSSNLATIG
jgi:FO synthase